MATSALRVLHTGRQATQGDVICVLGALGLGLRSLGLPADIGTALEAALDG